MKSQTFNYREHLVLIYHVFETIKVELYATGLQTAMDKGDLDLGSVFNDGDEIPGDLNLLKAVGDENGQIFALMIEEICSIQQRLVNLNALSAEELQPREAPSECEEEGEEEPEILTLEVAQVLMYGYFLHLYVRLVQLDNRSLDEPEELYDRFDAIYFQQVRSLPFEDTNARMLAEQLVRLFELNLEVDYLME